jgi:glycosyltransferase involved in cell wall biosynthesis
LIHYWHDAVKDIGGTTLHLSDIIKGLRNKFNFHVLAPENNIYKLYSYWEDGEETIEFNKIESSFSKTNFYNSEYREMLDEIVDVFRIDILHIHHLKGHFFDIKDIIKENDLRTVISLHDFYAVCPLTNKLIKNEFYCGTQKNRKCNECSLSINSWRKEWEKLLSMANKLIVPSKSAKEEISID